ncbi:MAG TPA: dienelactone hydrolase family protein [Candidatus Acidoferrales bacterium]|nr:dienelactone hydrolase family protein [Candidatus Acidoferrales bacterium]
MTEKEIEIRTADGNCDAVLYWAEDGKKRPGVIHYPDIMGIRPSHRAMAKRLAEQGYTVVLVNPFFRTVKGKCFDFTPNFAGDERTMKRFGELAGPLSPEVMERDAKTYADFLSTQGSVSGAKIGAVGYCFTGQTALRTAAALPNKVGAIASFHGGGLYTDKPTSPHLVLSRIPKSGGPELYFGHAVNDHSMPQEAIDRLDVALKAWGGKYESEIYSDALHGWTVADSAAYNQLQAERAFSKMKDLFAAMLQ